MRQAQEILDVHWDGRLPIDPKQIARSMGLRVVENPMMCESGMIEVDGSGAATITVNSTEFGPRQSFTVAHEIGHYALGHVNLGNRLLRDEASNFMTGTFMPVEREANRFAASLLMPARMINYVIQQGNNSINQLATIFGVSEVAMKWRLVNLGLLNAN
ncbi:MAG: ImmA/IrrE family metallo-endopeptidase [Pseudomonas sp.]|uniref:ImmA/IrrE family metallo-endopeptidase n=1 Tax=Pseudomonas sp. TaxID=306 RepID=UPI001D4C2B7F|nr:ImmA/IrrE family metallo-endopeptidase [Pseudomonas sp.]MPT00241.1 ImmA/IrrE family metallo-endopeptidase [Pseudomonas sp.]